MTDAKDVNDNIRRAMDLVSALCDGSREWIMSIPARVDHDPDIVISEALREARDHIDTLTRERDEALAMLGWTKESSLWQAAAAANQEVGHLRAERDALKT